jgi:C-terminal processing protease CtpA/Prc
MRRNVQEPTASSLARWRTARGIVLGAIVLAGSMATSAAVMYRLAGTDCAAVHQARHVERGYTYSGIGAVIQQQADDTIIVRHVLPNGPAHKVLRDGAVLISVDGVKPGSLEGWAMALRGPASTEVEIEVAYPRSGHETVLLTRKLIRIRR